MHGLPCSRCHALLDDLEVRPRLLDLIGDVGQIPHRAPQAVEAGHDEGVTLAEDREDFFQLGPALAFGAAGLFLEDHAHAGARQHFALHG